MAEDGPLPTLAWPDHDSGPTPPPDSAAAKRDELRTRKPLALWDRVKFLVFFAMAWLVLVWNVMSNNPLVPFSDAARQQLRSGAWVLVLGCLELIRQGHYLLSENLGWYHQFWTERVFGGLNRQTGRLNDWNRYRLARACKWLVFVGVIAMILGRIYRVPPVEGLFRLPHAIWSSMPFVAQAALIMFIAVGQFGAIFWFLSRGGTEVYFPDDIKTRFTDVWGQDAVLERVKENMVFLENPESIEEKGGYVPGGILLWGPPGTGKTLIAEAVAGETGKPFVFVDPGAFINMFFGVGILKVKSLFRKLRKLAVRYGGVIVFFDEADALGNRGQLAGGFNNAAPAEEALPSWAQPDACGAVAYASPGSQRVLAGPRPFVMGAGMGGGGGMGTLQALLTEISGLKKPRGFVNRVIRRVLGMRPKAPPKYRIIIMMATNMPSALDEALLRPGRIDRIYKVGYPKKEGRKRTFEGYLSKISHELTDEQIDRLAIISPYATGASIKDMVNEALVLAIRDGRETVSWLDVLKAKALKTYGMPDGMDYVQRERHNIALHEACHAVAMYRLKRHTTIDVATIEGRNGNGGFVNEIPLEERFVDWRTEVENDVMTFLASLAGERMFYEGDNTQGVGGDMGAATRLVTTAISRHAMGDMLSSREVTIGSIGAVNFRIEDGADRLVMDGPFGQAVESKLRELYERTVSLLEENRHEILAVTHALEVHKTISGEDVAAILEGTEGPTVDGRTYWQAGVPQLLEEYHRAALVAHQTNSPIDRELPAIEAGVIDVSGGPSRRSRRLRLGADEPEGGEGAGEEAAVATRPRRRARAVPLNGDGNGNGDGKAKAPSRRARTPEAK